MCVCVVGGIGLGGVYGARIRRADGGKEGWGGEGG